MSNEFFADIASKFFEALDSPESLSCYLMMKNGEFTQLVSKRVDPIHYNNSSDYFRACAAVDFLRKAKLPTGIDTQQKAVDAFLASEKACCISNARLSPFIHDQGPFGPRDEALRRFLRRVRREIVMVLGPAPRELIPRFGPGGTFEDKGKFVTVPDKMSSRPTVTGPLRDFTPLWWETAWSRALVADRPHLSDPKTVRGNRFVTVPKDGTTDRGIAIEPSINIFFQLGLGRALRHRLERTGINIDNGQARHRALARAASIEGHLSTIDLSSASDSVCTNLVRLIIPDDWLDLMKCLRSPLTLLQGKWIHLQKFSSMGNGFTFELETLIFLCVARALVNDEPSRAQISVYGDDIIVPSHVAPSLIKALDCLGFKTNVRKTFVESAFRESCGGDFFIGADVRPFYLKEIPYEPQHYLSLANGITRVRNQLDESNFGGFKIDARFVQKTKPGAALLALGEFIFRHLPSSCRLRGPDALGDVVFRDDNPMTWTTKHRNSIRWVRAYVPIPTLLRLEFWSPEVQLASALYGVSSRGVSPRSMIAGHKCTWIAFS
jgi:hypothetical protein